MIFGFIHYIFQRNKENITDKEEMSTTMKHINLLQQPKSLLLQQQQQSSSSSSSSSSTASINKLQNKIDKKFRNNELIIDTNHQIIYLLIIILFGLLFSISLFFYFHINHVTNVNVFNRNFQSDFVTGEIKNILLNLLNERRQDNLDGLTTIESEPPRTYLREHVRNERKLGKNMVREKRDVNIFDDNIVSPGEASGPEVEFFNPKLRHELEKKDADVLKKTGHKGAAPGGDSWVWLTSYSRIPYDAITGFCRATKEYCPLGPPGMPGLQGLKGNRGDVGLPGPPGLEGKQGSRGAKGEPGFPGITGLDGRDGVPGEPGLDGLNGRAGNDGKDGKDGKNGTDGRHGTNGNDGAPGNIGPQGPPGNIGPKGIAGPRGRTGKNGINGIPGIPGINAWKYNVHNGTAANKLLIPPTITGSDSPDASRPIIVHEGDNLRLRCPANGHPHPHVEWKREDGKTVAVGVWKDTSMSGHILNMTKVNRVHMGTYTCHANNGIPPSTNQSFQIDVHFAPLIKIQNSNVYATNGSTVTLECEVEMFPEAIKYWERINGRLLESGEKYKMETHTDGYKSLMRLNITKMNEYDFGEYHCITKNELGMTRAIFQVIAQTAYLKPIREPPNVKIFGNKPPELVAYEALCPPQATCECADPRDIKCKDTVISLFDLIGGRLIITALNTSYPGLTNRSMDCVMYAVGKPVYHKYTDQAYNSWLKDALPQNDDVGEKIWATNETDTHYLYEYNNKAAYRNNQSNKKYKLLREFRGNANVVYNGSFYYNDKLLPYIIRYDLHSEQEIKRVEIPGLKAYTSNFLYLTNYNYVDFNVDDNGLWIIYTTQDSNYTIVAQLNHLDLSIRYGWNISVNHHKTGEMFIVCGVLYAIDSVGERTTKIRFALDLYRGTIVDLGENLTFTNPFRKTTTVGYNHRNKELYTIDKGNQLTYPIRYHEGGYNLTSAEKIDENTNPMLVGYDLNRND